MQETGEERTRRLREKEAEQIAVGAPARPLLPPDLPTIPYTALAEAPQDSPIATEWNYYRGQVGRLLAAGNQGKWVLIKGERILGIWDSLDQATQARASVVQPVMLKQVLEREPLLRIGYNRVCRS
jgi:hypothetical protein